MSQVEPLARSSHQSEGSTASTGTTNSSGKVKSRSLRGNLTRQHRDRDPFTRYEVLQVLGEGSMGSVRKVRKKPQAVGFSARTNIVAREAEQERWDACFQLPLIGGLLKVLLGKFSNEFVDKAGRDPSPIGVDMSFHTTTTATSSGDASAYKDVALAMKSIRLTCIKDPIFVEELKNEIAILKTLDHPNIVRVMETYNYNNQIFVVMELCSGGDLYTRDPYTEEEAAKIIASILSAVSFMHSRGVIHRDLKYENVLFVDKSPQAEIKLIDFGLSKEIEEHEKLTQGAGTIVTMAPEVIGGSYSNSADVWSIGVIAFMLMSSRMPFFGTSRKKMAKAILTGTYDFKGRRWNRISSEGKQFIKDLLVVDPADRATVREAMRAPWLLQRHSATDRNPHSGELANVKRSIERYVNYPKLRQLSLMIVAHHSTSDEIGILRKVFQHYDQDGNGDLTFDEFKCALHDAGFSEEDYRKLFDAMDVDGTGLVHYTEFLAATMEAAGWISATRLAEAFDRVDHEDTGYITKENLQYLLGNDIPADEIEAIMNEAAPNSEKGISYADFMSQWDDDREEFERQWEKYMIPVPTSVKSGTEFLDGNSDSVSELSYDGSSDTNDPGKLDFFDRKALSQRKLAKLSIDVNVPIVKEE